MIIISNRTCPKWNCNVRDWKPNENKFLDNHTLVLFWCYSTGLYINEIIVCLFILLRQANLSAFQNTNTYYLVQRVLCQPIYVSNILRIWFFSNAYTLALQYFSFLIHKYNKKFTKLNGLKESSEMQKVSFNFNILHCLMYQDFQYSNKST